MDINVQPDPDQGPGLALDDEFEMYFFILGCVCEDKTVCIKK